MRRLLVTFIFGRSSWGELEVIKDSTSSRGKRPNKRHQTSNQMAKSWKTGRKSPRSSKASKNHLKWKKWRRVGPKTNRVRSQMRIIWRFCRSRPIKWKNRRLKNKRKNKNYLRRRWKKLNLRKSRSRPSNTDIPEQVRQQTSSTICLRRTTHHPKKLISMWWRPPDQWEGTLSK